MANDKVGFEKDSQNLFLLICASIFKFISCCIFNWDVLRVKGPVCKLIGLSHKILSLLIETKYGYNK